jgi:mRNA interferase RelE/StbE
MNCSACARQRRGHYRALFTLDVEDQIMYVHRIEHRSDVYKPH